MVVVCPSRLKLFSYLCVQPFLVQRVGKVNGGVCLPSFCLCWAWDAWHERALMCSPPSFLPTPGHWGFEAEFCKKPKTLLCPAAQCQMLQSSGCAGGIWCLLAWLGSSRDLLFLAPASCHAELSAAEPPLCLNSNFRHVFRIAAKLHVISQHWQLPTLHVPADPRTVLELGQLQLKRQDVGKT